MQIQVHKQVYPEPVTHIDVPKEFQDQGFEVIFLPLVAQSNELPTQILPARKRQPNPALKGLMTIHDDLTPLDNLWELD